MNPTYKVEIHLYSANGKPIDLKAAEDAQLSVRAWYMNGLIAKCAGVQPPVYSFEGPRSEDPHHVLVVVKEADQVKPKLFRWYEFYFDDRTASMVHVRLHPLRTDRRVRDEINETLKGIQALRKANVIASAIRKELDESVRFLVTQFATSTNQSEGDRLADLVDSFNVSAPVAFRSDTELVVATNRVTTTLITISPGSQHQVAIGEECPTCVVVGDEDGFVIRAWDANLDWPCSPPASRDIGGTRCLACHSSPTKQLVAAGGSNGVISLFSKTPGAAWQHEDSIYNAASPLQALAVSSNGETLATVNLKNQLIFHNLSGDRKQFLQPVSVDLAKNLGQKGLVPTALTFCGSSGHLALAAGLGAAGKLYFINQSGKVDCSPHELPCVSALRWQPSDGCLLIASMEVGDDNMSKLIVRRFLTLDGQLPTDLQAPESLVCVSVDDNREPFG